MDETQIEQAVQAAGKTAPRITPDHIDRLITGARYHVFPGTTVTVCCLELQNGYQVVGWSAAASAENFDALIGEQIARAEARDKIWALEGYLLRQQLSQAEDLRGNT